MHQNLFLKKLLNNNRIFYFHSYSAPMTMQSAPNTMIKTLCDFSSAEEVSRWQIVNDDIMGGNSTSEFNWNHESTATFSGRIRLLDQAGFASIRAEVNGLTGRGIMLRIKGTGSFKFKLRTDPFLDGVNYTQVFQGNGQEWRQISLPFTDFRATFRGLVIPDAPPLSVDQVQQMGILISGKQEGPFSLQIDWIKNY